MALFPTSAFLLQLAFGDVLSPFPAHRTAVVLLHEDYPLELPVFGRKAVLPGDIDHVVFCLGAVRDMTQVEEAALVAACRAVGVRCLGCNLGRTAEFTSKIIHAINGHHLYGRLMPAVCRLAASIAADPTAGSKTCKAAPQVSFLTKMAPKDDAEAVPDEAAANTEPQRRRKHKGKGADPVATDVPPEQRRGAVAAAASAPGRDVASSSRSAVPPAPAPPQCPTVLHFVVCTPVRSGDLGPEPERRPDLFHVVQATVCSLWRSRVARRSGSGATVADWESRLTLLFADGGLLTVDGAFVERLAAQHQAAPSEYQILNGLRDAVVAAGLPRGAPADDPAELTARQKALKRQLVQEVFRPYAGAVLSVVDVCDAAEETGGPPALSTLAYRSKCWCARPLPAPHPPAPPRAAIFLLRNARPRQPLPSAWVPKAVRMAAKRHCAEAGRSLAEVWLRVRLGAGPQPSTGLALSLLQHFHYHGRLLPAVDRALRGDGAGDEARAAAAGSPRQGSAALGNPDPRPPDPVQGTALVCTIIARQSTAAGLRRVMALLDFGRCVAGPAPGGAEVWGSGARAGGGRAHEADARGASVRPIVQCVEQCAQLRDAALCGQCVDLCLRALGIDVGPGHRVWPVLLSLDKAAAAPGTALPRFAPMGCELVLALLKLPAAATARLIEGYDALLSGAAAADVLLHMGLDRGGSRVLEACLKPDGALSKEVRVRTVRCLLQGNGVRRLSLDPSGGWVVSAAWAAVEDDAALRQEVQSAVRAAAPTLRQQKKGLLLRVVLGEALVGDKRRAGPDFGASAPKKSPWSG